MIRVSILFGVTLMVFSAPVIAHSSESGAMYQCLRPDPTAPAKAVWQYTNKPSEVRKRYGKDIQCKRIYSFGGAPAEKATKETTSKKKRTKRRTKKTRAYVPPSGDPVKKMVPSTQKRISKKILQTVREAADRYGLSEDFVLGVIYVESRFNPNAVSRVGAMGLMQLMPGTARDLGVEDAFNPKENIMGGTRLLRQLANRYDGDYVRVISAYHAGGGAVARKDGIPYEQTDQYVRMVLDAYYGFVDGTLEIPGN
tara:strand:- start:153 stop:914 length:762 start_codon:yes stop_codon:yes gene_type:complete